MLFQAQQDGILVCLRWEIQGGDLLQRPCRIVTQAWNFLPRRKAFLSLPCFNDRVAGRKQEQKC